MNDLDAVGAGPAGLACAASMDGLGLYVTVLEKANAVGPVWRRHYDRLHLHTDRGHSGLLESLRIADLARQYVDQRADQQTSVVGR